MKFWQSYKFFNKAMLRSTNIVILWSCILFSSYAQAQSDWEGGPPVSANDMGGVGLMHTRSARFFDDGHYEFGTSFSNPLRKYYMTWQIMPRVETTFRYTDITNRPGLIYPIPQSEKRFWSDLVGLHDRNSYLDRTFDLKILLAKEGHYWPQIAVGLQDFMGTGMFSGEYLVASKRFGKFDFSLGLGWGEFASRSTFSNPLKLFGNNFNNRFAKADQGGNFTFHNFFSGEKIGLFGGVEYFPDITGLSFKLEYDSDDPDSTNVRANGRGLGVQPGRLPVNFGAVYQPNSYFSVNLGLLRGQSPVFGFALKTNFNGPGLPKSDPPPPVVVPRSWNRRDLVFAESETGKKNLSKNLISEIQKAVKAQNVKVSYAVFEGSTAYVQVRQTLNNKGIFNDPLFLSTVFSKLPKSINTLALIYADENGSKTRYHFREYIDIYNAFKPLTKNQISSFKHANGKTIVKFIPSKKVKKMTAVGESLTTFFDLFLSSDEVILVSGNEELRIYPLQVKAQGQAEDLLNKLAAAKIEPRSISFKNQKMILEAPILQPDQITARETVASLATELGLKTVQFKDRHYKFDNEKGLTLTKDELRDLFNRVAVELNRQYITVYSLDVQGREAIIYSPGSPWSQVSRFIGRAARGMARVLPPEIETLTVVETIGGIEVNRTSLLRSDVEKMSLGTTSSAELLKNTKFLPPLGGMAQANKGAKHPNIYPGYNWYIVPKLEQNIGDPNEGVYNADIDLAIGADFALAPNWSASVVIKQKIMGDLDKIKRTSNSVLPHVRSDLVSYLKSGDTTLSQLQVTYLRSITPELHFRASGGIFESMYGGVGVETLYIPFGKPWAFGVDVAWVKQRGFNQLFGFRDYQIVTGFASLYYELPFWDMRAIVRAGRYLAGDRGVTIDLSRRFKSGIRVGAFSTFTNVSAEDFGEGSFDKGFYIRFPMDMFLQRSTRQSASFTFRPITRDGGAVAGVGPDLYGVLSGRGYNEIKKTWGTIFN